MNAPTSRQLAGSEYGGVQPTSSTIQPMPAEALDAADQLRLGYLTGDEKNAEGLEDRRQMLGLRPASGLRPNWLKNTGQVSEAEIERVGEDPLEVQE